MIEPSVHRPAKYNEEWPSIIVITLRVMGGRRLRTMLYAGLIGGTFGTCITTPVGVIIGSVIGEWLDPGSSTRRHAFEEPPVFLGVLVGWVAGIAGLMVLSCFVTLEYRLEPREMKPLGRRIDDLD